MNEKVIQFGENNNMIGISTEPSANNKLPVIVFLNAGLLYHVGPNRLYVNLSRNLSYQGYLCFRFDFRGCGYSQMYYDKNEDIEKAAENDVINAMNEIQKQYGINNFILCGICYGADIAYKTALQDTRIIGCFLVNGNYLQEGKEDQVFRISNEMIKKRYYRKKIFNLHNWLKLFKVKNITFFSKLKTIVKVAKQHIDVKECQNKNNANTDLGWETLIQRNMRLKIIYSEGSEGLDILNFFHKNLKQFIKNNEIELEIIKNTDHVFTQHWAQERLQKSFAKWLKQNYK